MTVRWYKHPREKRHLRVRAKISGTKECPRLSVFRSSQHIYVQLIDDSKDHTLAAASDLVLDEKIKKQKNKSEIARLIGQDLAQKAIGLGIKKVVFDRGGYKYHGRVKALAEGAREVGLKF